MKRLLFVSALIIAGFIACKKTSTPSDILPESKMVDIITDIQLTDAAFKQDMIPQKYKKNPQSYYLDILAAYQTDSAQYQNSLLYYSEDPKVIKRIYQKVEKKIQGE